MRMRSSALTHRYHETVGHYFVQWCLATLSLSLSILVISSFTRMHVRMRALGSGGKRVRVCTPRWLISSQISLLDRGKRVDGPCASPRPRFREQPGVAANIIVAQLSTVRAVKWRREAVVLLMIAPGFPNSSSLTLASLRPLFIFPLLSFATCVNRLHILYLSFCVWSNIIIVTFSKTTHHAFVSIDRLA